ncbi:hypothetical protein EHM69_09620 [candidate division KSB1 bacterium]|nr:MAG: hypothetical protein EHM69_09620 [candidate division KSB1 bacterium]
MIHYEDDRLLASVLGLLSEDESTEIIEHALVCESCRARLNNIKSEVAVLGGIAPQADLPVFPKRRTRVFAYSAILKIAALLMVGFLGGLATSRIMSPLPINVVPAYANPTPPPDSLAFFAVSDATALKSTP